MDLVQYKCPCCGAGLQFLPDTQKLSCQSCGNQYDLETIEEYEQEEQADAEQDLSWEYQNKKGADISARPAGRRWRQMSIRSVRNARTATMLSSSRPRRQEILNRMS